MVEGEKIEIMAVNLACGTCLTVAGDVCEITTMLDEHGEETTHPLEAAACVAAHPSGVWLAIDLRCLEPATVH